MHLFQFGCHFLSLLCNNFDMDSSNLTIGIQNLYNIHINVLYSLTKLSDESCYSFRDQWNKNRIKYWIHVSCLVSVGILWLTPITAHPNKKLVMRVHTLPYTLLWVQIPLISEKVHRLWNLLHAMKQANEGSTLALKPNVDITTSPEYGY